MRFKSNETVFPLKRHIKPRPPSCLNEPDVGAEYLLSHSAESLPGRMLSCILVNKYQMRD